MSAVPEDVVTSEQTAAPAAEETPETVAPAARPPPKPTGRLRHAAGQPKRMAPAPSLPAAAPTRAAPPAAAPVRATKNL